ncbi:hypothetical protein M9H77_20528 [Catharanthus roseus]|uniref:Uncharacterized protein n=1 Tax=Catharanthus roseus TaxID=4058 RepID=A0ACC0ALQ1_CATRO|nr:hypothetical protein M9H77_20528 [Catharanthus roseus]
MKLRLRSFDSKETIRIEVPVQCSLQQLKEILSHNLSSSLSAPPDSIHISLNRKDEIDSSSDDEYLQSLGITSGDLIYFKVGSNGFSSETLVPNSNCQPPISKRTASCSEPSSRSSETNTMEPQISKKLDLNSQIGHNDQSEGSELNTNSDESLDTMELDDLVDESALEGIGKSFSAPGFLRKVFTEEFGGSSDGGLNRKLLVIAVHAVLLESGFVGFDMISKTEIKRFQFQTDLPSCLSLFYTLPGIVGPILPSSECHNGVVVLKFQTLGGFQNVYGSLKSGSAIHYVPLKEDELISFLNVAWANCGLREEITGNDGVSWTTPAREVFNFWKTVKDKLALPLLIDLCERTGLPLPPCFMRLPTELQLKILESLPGVDLAKVSCVSSELRYLSSNDDLWKQKFFEQFGDAWKRDQDVRSSWKKKFVLQWESTKMKRKISRLQSAIHPRRIIDPIQRFPRWPWVIGGYYDMGPHIHPFGQVRLPDPRYMPWSRTFNCNLGGLGNRNVG